MGIDSISLNSKDVYSTNSTAVSANTIDNYTAKAEAAGLSISDYCTYDSNGNVKNIDIAKLNTDLKASRATDEEKELDVDSFHKSETIKNSQELKQKKSDADDEKTNIDSEYKDAMMKYASVLNKIDNEDVQKEWDSIKAQEQKLTSITASSTTILEGAKEFIASLKKVISTTEQASISGTDDTKKKEEDNYVLSKIEKTTSAADNILDNPFFKSAYDTADKKDEKLSLEA